MKAVILAGGFGTRLSEESVLKPKPMVEIGGRPILWHIMKIYSHYGINEFVICLGYRGYVIKEYFANYFLHMSDVTFHMDTNKVDVHFRRAEPWTVTLVDTGDQTQTGGRLKRVREHLGDDDFCFTYGDGLADIDISKLVAFHKAHGKLATITAVKPPGRYGALDIAEDCAVRNFLEKPRGDGGFINGGFFVLSPKVIDTIKDDTTPWELEPLETLVARGELRAFEHNGFWHALDTLRDRTQLENMIASGTAPWKVWE
ncbi:MAG TPA: glucose-1-phosphate cytidylyltransferase [Bryobacteraceae bacterium]|nr:glucose-1-phosphate cytidylyltransferase [Bryobacteraceae bacterium]